jgi:hypothetical protein
MQQVGDQHAAWHRTGVLQVLPVGIAILETTIKLLLEQSKL